MIDLLVALGVTLVVLLLCVFGMAIGLFFNRKPIKHCGGAAFEYKGTKIECGVCANAGKCKKRKKHQHEHPEEHSHEHEAPVS